MLTIPLRSTSPEVHPDRRVTFRLRAPGAKEVVLSLEGAERQPMLRDDQGVWSVTTAALPPDYYGYSFAVDGVTFTDPSNFAVKPNFQEVLPEVERNYRTQKTRDSRAVAGLSMGGGQALAIGLNALDTFAWIGAFSSAVPKDFSPALSRAPRLLWIACGIEDGLIGANRSLHAGFQQKKVQHTWIETPGGHTWMLWRRNLAAFAALLFR